MDRSRRWATACAIALIGGVPHVVASVTTPAGAAPAGYVRALAEGGPTDVVADAARVYVTNHYRHRVDVLSLATGQMEAPIAVGTGPLGLDLSADGRLLYVANNESIDISVVDLTSGVR